MIRRNVEFEVLWNSYISAYNSLADYMEQHNLCTNKLLELTECTEKLYEFFHKEGL